MVKRLLILAVAASAFAVGTGADAACVGRRNIATVPAKDGDDVVTVEIVSIASDLCDDGTLAMTNPLGEYPSTLRITGAAACELDTDAGWDPFGFGAAIHGYNGPDGAEGTEDDAWDQTDCNIDITRGGFTTPFLPTVDRTDGVYLGKDTTISGPADAPGMVVVAGRLFLTAEGAAGRMYTGVGAEL